MKAGECRDPARREAIVAARNAGLTLAAIARQHGVTYETISGVLERAKNAGFEVDEFVVSKAKAERLKRMLAMWNTGKHTSAEVGVAFSLPRGSVCRILWEARRDGFRVLKIPAAVNRRKEIMRRAQVAHDLDGPVRPVAECETPPAINGGRS